MVDFATQTARHRQLGLAFNLYSERDLQRAILRDYKKARNWLHTCEVKVPRVKKCHIQREKQPGSR